MTQNLYYSLFIFPIHYAWYVRNAEHKAHPVGERNQTGKGLYDMAGNVGEWVEDCYHKSYQGAPEDGGKVRMDGSHSCTDTRRVIRGGSWFTDPANLRSASRTRYDPGTRNGLLGFRLAQDLSL
jgi:formylglycine-generating enzyme required for sulfatase activity